MTIFRAPGTSQSWPAPQRTHQTYQQSREIASVIPRPA